MEPRRGVLGCEVESRAALWPGCAARRARRASNPGRLSGLRGSPDVRLPGLDGLTLTRQLKTDPRTASIPVVALTAHASLADRDAALDAGCTAWMTKPLDTRLLAQTLLGLL